MSEDPVVPASASPQQQPPGSIGSSVIPIVNKLQDIFAQLGSSSTIDLPQVAVVGSQSSGKSSVLEALVGRDFLPRGSDICTRRPLVLQLVNCPMRPDAAEGDEWGEFLHVPRNRFFDFNEIRSEIQDINRNRSIKDALAQEEAFFRNQHVYHGLSHCCGIPQLAKKLNQILVHQIKAVLPALKSRINSQLVAVAKADAAYGEVAESKTGQGVKLLNILTKYCEAFTSMVEGKNGEMSMAELSGGARIHYIFQSIFVKSLEEVDPCEDVTDEDIRMAIQNATGPKGALFVPEVPFEVLVRRQIGRLLDPSLQCVKFIYDELIKMSHHCLVNELQRFPILRKSMDEVIGKFLRDSLQPAEAMITHIIAMEDAVDSDKLQSSERTVKSRAILGRSGANGIIPDQGVRPASEHERPGSAGTTSGSSWVSSIFGGSDNRALARESTSSKSCTPPVHHVDHSLSMIQLREPPLVLKPSDSQTTEQEAIEIAITKLLLKSYYDIVRKNIEDSVPKAIMHFLVNHTKRELHNVFIRKLYRDNLFEDMLREPDDIMAKRKRIRETLQVLQHANKTLEELPLDAETAEKGYSIDMDSTGLPRIHGLPSSFYAANSDSSPPYMASPTKPRQRKSAHSGEQPSPLHYNAYSNGSGYHSGSGAYTPENI